MVVQTTLPLAIILLLFSWPALQKLRGKPHAESARSAASLTLMGLEVVTPNVATTLMQIFVCEEFDDGWFLQQELVSVHARAK